MWSCAPLKNQDDAIFIAVGKNQTEEIRRLVKFGGNPNVTDDNQVRVCVLASL